MKLTSEVERTTAQLIMTASWKNLMQFNYKKSAEIIELYEVEVYDLKYDQKRGYFFFGFDLAEQKIKQFNVSKIIGTVNVGKEFKPRYDKKA